MARRRPGRALPFAAALVATAAGAAMLVRRLRGGPASGRGRPSAPASPAAAAAGFETTDLSTRLAARVLAGFAAAVLVSVAGLFLMIHVFHRGDADRPPQTAQQTATITPPGPRLQADPVAELNAITQRELARLHGYAWADDSRTEARIPIDRAMQLVAGRSLAPPPGAVASGPGGDR